jgi:hypothetical protein
VVQLLEGFDGLTQRAQLRVPVGADLQLERLFARLLPRLRRLRLPGGAQLRLRLRLGCEGLLRAQRGAALLLLQRDPLLLLQYSRREGAQMLHFRDQRWGRGHGYPRLVQHLLRLRLLKLGR